MDYEEKYNAALERAKKLQETCDSTAVVGWCEYIFPELQESEDEKIRKDIISYLRNEKIVKRYISDIEIDEWITWLEKQCHMLDPDKVIEWLECEAFQGWAEPIDIRPIIRKFKKDFGL